MRDVKTPEIEAIKYCIVDIEKEMVRLTDANEIQILIKDGMKNRIYALNRAIDKLTIVEIFKDMINRG